MLFLWMAVSVLVGSLIIYAFQKELTQLVSNLLDLITSLLKTSDLRLGVAINKVSQPLTKTLPFMLYVFAFGIALVGIISSGVDFSLIRFSVNVIGLADATLFHTKYGVVSTASAIAAFIVLMEWILGYLHEKHKKERKADGSSRSKISKYLFVFIGIVMVSAFLTFERVIEMEAGTRVPVVGVFNGASVEVLAFVSAFLTVLTAVAIYWTAPFLEIALYGLMFLVIIATVVVLSILRGIVWLILKLIEGIRPVIVIIMELLSKIGSFITGGFKKNRTAFKLLIPAAITTTIMTSGCSPVSSFSQRTQIIVILDTSASFRNLLGKAVKKCEQIIDALSPGSEFIAISISASSYKQCDGLAYVKIPPGQTEREKYSKAAKAEYYRQITELKQPAIDNLKKIVRARSSPGSDIAGAIIYANNLFSDTSSNSRKILVILSDLFDNSGIELDSCDFKGVNVWALFVIHTDSPSEYKRRIAPYEEFFTKHNASSVKFLDPIRSSALDVREILELGEEQ